MGQKVLGFVGQVVFNPERKEKPLECERDWKQMLPSDTCAWRRKKGVVVL